MIKNSFKKYNTAREFLEEEIRIWRSNSFYYDFDEDGTCWQQVWDAANVNTVYDAHEMVDIALNHLDKFGQVYFEGYGGIGIDLGQDCESYRCKIDNTQRATKKEIIKRSRLYKLYSTFGERFKKAENMNEKKINLRGGARALKMINALKEQYDWRDEMFRENGLVGLRNVNGDILVPCGDYEFIHGCDYGNDTTFAIASRNGLYGLIKRDGKGTVVTPFNYIDIDRWDYNKVGVASNKQYDIHIGYREADITHRELLTKGEVDEEVYTEIVQDLIVDGQVVVSSAHWIRRHDSRQGAIEYYNDQNGKKGFVGILWDWVVLDPIFDDIKYNEYQPYFTFIKDGQEGVMTIAKEFIPLEKWNSMTDEEQDELWDDIVGCLRIDWTLPIPIVPKIIN